MLPPLLPLVAAPPLLPLFAAPSFLPLVTALPLCLLSQRRRSCHSSRSGPVDLDPVRDAWIQAADDQAQKAVAGAHGRDGAWGASSKEDEGVAAVDVHNPEVTVHGCAFTMSRKAPRGRDSAGSGGGSVGLGGNDGGVACSGGRMRRQLRGGPICGPCGLLVVLPVA